MLFYALKQQSEPYIIYNSLLLCDKCLIRQSSRCCSGSAQLVWLDFQRSTTPWPRQLCPCKPCGVLSISASVLLPHSWLSNNLVPSEPLTSSWVALWPCQGGAWGVSQHKLGAWPDTAATTPSWRPWMAASRQYFLQWTNTMSICQHILHKLNLPQSYLVGWTGQTRDENKHGDSPDKDKRD